MKPPANASDAIFAAFCHHHRCLGMAGPDDRARHALAESSECGNHGLLLFQADRLRAWAAILNAAASALEHARPRNDNAAP